jgi:hypothetical protein
MAKLLLLSVLAATVIIPLWASRAQHPGRALKRTVFFTLLFNVLYAAGALLLYPRLAFR